MNIPNRAAFMSRIHSIMNYEDAALVELAYLLAKRIHHGQVRKELGPDGLPLRYFEHLRRTALSLIDEAGVVDPAIIITALLHDSIEDTEDQILVGVLLDRLFDKHPQVSEFVRALTKMPKAGYLARLTSKAANKPEILLIKAADRLDNLRTLPAKDPEFCKRQKRETIEVYLPLFQKYPEAPSGFWELVNNIKNIAYSN